MDGAILTHRGGSARPRSEWGSLVELLRSRAQSDANRTLYSFLSEELEPASTVTHAELDARARAIGAWLQSVGASNRRVLLLFPPGLDYIAAFFGCLYAGAVAVPAYPPSQNRNVNRLRAIVNDAGPAIVLTTQAVMSKIEPRLNETPDLKALRWMTIDTIAQTWAGQWRHTRADGNTLAFLQYTSGSTADPKGVMITHGNLLHNERMIQRAFGQTEQSVIVGWLPLFHDMGLIGNVLQPLYVGAQCVLLSPMSFLQRPFRWLETISRYRGTTSGGPNFAYDFCVRKIGPVQREALDLSSWTIAFNGSEPVHNETLERFCAAFEPCGFRRQAFFPCYGLAEATLFVSGGPRRSKPKIRAFQRSALERNHAIPAAHGETDTRHLVSCGNASRKQQIRIVDPEVLTQCTTGRVGEIWVSGRSVAQGYWGKPEESKHTFQARLADTCEGPYLRTGDLGFIEDGQLFITGRLKDLIIIRGRNCYPEDIEHTLGLCNQTLRPGEGAAFSIDISGEERLVVVHEVARGYRGDELAGVLEDIRKVVAEEYDLQLYAVSLVRPGTLLKTSSGKIQRQAMKKAFLNGSLEVLLQWKLSESAVEETGSPDAALGSLAATKEWIASKVASLLGLTRSQIATDEPLARYGLDSLAAIELAHSIELNLGASLPVTNFMQDASISGIAAQVLARLERPADSPSAVPPPVEQTQASFPLSHGQAALWFLHRLAPENAAYNVIGGARIHGSFNADALRKAFQALTERHPALRSRFDARGGEPFQIIQEHLEVSFHTEDLSGQPKEALSRRVLEEAQRPFDLENGPVFRVTLFNVAHGEQLLLIAAHHIVLDLWSLAVLVNELGVFYTAQESGSAAELPAPEASYEDYVRMQQQLLEGPRGARLLEYWQQQLSGELPVLSLTTDYPRPSIQTYEGGSESISFDHETTGKLRVLARQNLTTLYTVLLAAYQVLLHRHTGQQELIVGSPTSGRTDRRFQSLIGYFVNPVPIRVAVDGALTFRQFLAQVRETVLAAFEHQEYPFALLVNKICPDRDLSRSPVFQTAFVFEKAPPFSDPSLAAFVLGEDGARLPLGSLALESVKINQEIAQFDLSMVVAPIGDGFTVALQYNKDLFSATTISRMLGHFEVLVGELIARPEQKISEVGILTAAEREELIHGFNDTTIAFRSHLCAHRLFESQTRKTPHAPALLSSDPTPVTYDELNRRANRLAHYLRSLSLAPDDRVALLLQRSTQMLVSMLAIHKAGAAYLPLDPAYPPERLSFMLDDASASVLICDAETAGKLPASNARILRLDLEAEAISRQDEHDPQETAQPQNLSHVIYTSGSTGRPKGVAVTHRNVVNFLDWALRAFTADELSCVFASTSICFDLSVFELFAPLACGGAVVLAEDALQLASHAQAGRVSMLNTVPSAMSELLRMKAVGRSVRTVNLAGEALKASLVEQTYSETCVERVMNLYGPTEYTTYTTAQEVKRGSEGQPGIGRAIANTRVYILDAWMEIVPVGVSGQIWIGGEGLARCYLKREGMTADRFMPDGVSGEAGERLYRTGDVGRWRRGGEIEYIGREDQQVKVRGYRIELAEIEAVLLRYPGIKEAAVVAREDHLGEKQIVSYLVTTQGQTVGGELRDYLRQTLPGYMIPQSFMTLDAMPLTRNGKVDRRSLPVPDANGLAMVRERVEPNSPMEEVVAGIWADVLGLGRISCSDNFFEIGGHSLKAVQVVSRLSDLLQLELPVRVLFEAPTVQSLTRVVEQAMMLERGVERSPIERVSRDEHLPLSFAQQRLWFLQRLEPDSHAYNISFSARYAGRFNVPALEQSINEIVRRHEALRTTFVEVEAEPSQIIAPRLALTLPVLDLSRVPETERERHSQRLLLQEARRPFDLKRGPLVRMTLLRLGEEECVLSLSMHHTISDGWSSGVFIREMMRHYEAFCAGTPSPLPALDIQYADFAVWQRQRLQEDAAQRQLAYWKKQLSGPVAVLEIPTERPRPPVWSERGASVRFTLPKQLTVQLQALARREGATLFMTLLAGFQLLLSRYSGQTDVSVGTPVANRVRAEIEPLIGAFVNMLVMRVDLSGDPSFRELLGRVREVALGAYAHQDVPFERLVSEIQAERDLSRTPLFQVMLVLQNTPLDKLKLGGLQLQPEEIDNGTAKFDVSVQLTETEEGIAGRWEYSTDLFDAPTIERMAAHFRILLEGVVENDQRRISELRIVTDSEREELIHGFNDTTIAFRSHLCAHRLFESQTRKTPHAPALLSSDPTPVTYDELNRRANRLAHYLRSLSLAPDDRVALLLQRSTQMLVSMLAIHKAGAAYLPLDPAYPPERLSFMLDDASASVLICDAETAGKLPASNARILRLDLEAEAISRQDEHDPQETAQPQNLSHVIYTSGSTGRPKGVAVTHRNVVNFLDWALRAFTADELSCVFASTSICFDLSVFELFAPLACGGAVVLAEDALQLASHAQAGRVSMLNTVPSAMSELLRMKAVGRSVRTVNLAGEALKASLVEQTYSETCVERVMNLYGPTEYTTYTTAQEVKRGSEGQPGIGRAIANTRVYILDAWMEIVPVGVSGQIWIGGEGLARCYLKREGMTADRFMPDGVSGEAGERLYRTGDVGRWRRGGEIEYIGREDQQVKVRGYRIELAEIEAVLEQHSGVREAVVVVRTEAGGGGQRLVAYVVSAAAQGEQAVTVDELRHSLRERLPEYMLPSSFVFMEQLPLTPNGKVDRKALPAPASIRPELEAGYVAARTLTEQLLAQIWSEVLKVEQVGVHNNFFELGGHSLLATQVISRIRAVFQIELPLRRLFEAPTVAGLAKAVEQAQRENAGVESALIEPASREAALPLSFAQQRLWFLAQLEPNSAAYNMAMASRLAGRINIRALEASLSEIVRRHEVLRTSFAAVDEDPPRQVIAPHTGLSLPLIDLSRLPEALREESVRELFDREAQRPFDLSGGGLLRLLLVKLGAEQHALLLVMHHIISDGWSIGVFSRELVSLYEAFSRGHSSPLAERTIQYADYSVWQREWLTKERLSEQQGYWKEQLSGARAVLELPTDYPRPAVQRFRGAAIPFTLSSALTGELKALCREHSVTPFMALAAAFTLLLSRYSQQSDVCIGTPVAGRTRPETEELIGLFVNTLVLRTRFPVEQTVRELLAQVREVTLQAHAHQDLPFEKLVEELQPERSLSYEPLFQVMFVLQNTPTESVEIEGLSLSRMEVDAGSAQFDLTLRMEERAGEFECNLNYNTDLFERPTAERMARHFEHLLGEMVRDAVRPVREVEMLTAAEREQLLSEWNDTAREYDSAVPLHELIAAQAARTPLAVALVYEDERVTFAELNERANQVAHYLIGKGVGPERLVGICMERSVEMVLALLGVLKAGGAYVPLDPSYPKERLAFMLADSGVSTLLTQSQLLGQLPEMRGQAVCLDREWTTIAASSVENPQTVVMDDNLVYMIYTSGSTGQPKGAMNTHGGLSNRLVWMQRQYGLTPSDRVLQKTPFSFDVSVWEFFWPLMTGARMVLARPGGHQDSAYLIDLINAEQITTLHFVPSMLQAFLDEPEVNSCRSLRRVICSGEALPYEMQERFFERSTARLHNLYGPTEASIDVTFRECRADAKRLVPIGRPIANTEIYILDPDLQPVPVGFPGELYIGGRGLARGYHNRPGLTAEKFSPHPFVKDGAARRLYRTGDLARYRPDGAIEYLGRTDHQVKIRGFRIELGEIEAALAAYAGVRAAAVVAREDAPGHKYLAGYVTGDGEVSINDLRAYLQSKLPGYMVPATLMWLQQINLTPSGKLDRKSLPQPVREINAQEYSSPETPTEKILAEIWRQVLKVERVSIGDNFFALGGDSILSIHVAAAARRAGLRLTPQQLFQHQTLSKLALAAEENAPIEAQASGSRSSLRAGARGTRPVDFPGVKLSREEIDGLPARTDGGDIEDIYPLTPFQQGILFHVLDAPEAGIYLNQQRYTLQGELDVPAFKNAFQAVLDRHQIVRTAFILSSQSGPLQVVYRRLNLPWAVYDWRGLSSAEAAERMDALLRNDYELGFELARPPLMRLTLVRRAEDLYEFIWSFHLLLLDGPAGAVIFKELLALYQGFRAAQPVELELPVRYGDYIDWLQKQAPGQAESYWRQSLAGFTGPTSLGFDRVPLNGTAEQKGYDEKSLLLDDATTDALRSFARRHNLTLYTLIQGVWAVLVSRRSGTSDVVFGSAVSGRPVDFPGAESAVGLFVNTLPVRVNVPLDGPLASWLAALQTQQAEARRFELSSLVSIQGWSEVPRGQPLFESVLIFQNIPLDITSSEAAGLKVVDIRSTERTNLPLALIVEPGDRFLFRIVYQRSRFDDATIGRILENLQRSLIAMATNPEATLSSLSAHAETGRKLLIDSFNQSLASI